MNKQEYLSSVIKEGEAVAEQRLEKEYPNGDKVYVIDRRHIGEDGNVFYMEERFVVINEGTKDETTYPMK
jgi:hypothetical protein